MKKKDADRRAVAADDSKQRRGWLVEGKWYVITTVGPVYWGRLEYWDEGHFALDEATWVVDTGRISDFVLDPAKVAIEAEYVGRVLVERTAVQSLYPSDAETKVGTK